MDGLRCVDAKRRADLNEGVFALDWEPTKKIRARNARPTMDVLRYHGGLRPQPKNLL